MFALLQIMRSATTATRSIARFLREEEAATAVEYCVMLTMILMVAFVAIAAFGNKTNGVWGNIVSGLHAVGL